MLVLMKKSRLRERHWCVVAVVDTPDFCHDNLGLDASPGEAAEQTAV